MFLACIKFMECCTYWISGYTADSPDRSMERIEKEIQQLREREKELRYVPLPPPSLSTLISTYTDCYSHFGRK